MDFNTLLNERYSVRSFKQIPVEKEKLDLLLETARIAPTAGNRQPQRILVVADPDGLAKVDICSKCRFGAPLVLIVCNDESACWVRPYDQQNSGQVDASIVTTYLMLKAVELGLGSTWVMHFNPAKLREQFPLPDNITPIALLPLGYPADDAAPSEMHSKRNPLSDMLL